jgi:hypothetical protein
MRCKGNYRLFYLVRPMASGDNHFEKAEDWLMMKSHLQFSVHFIENSAPPLKVLEKKILPNEVGKFPASQ